MNDLSLAKLAEIAYRAYNSVLTQVGSVEQNKQSWDDLSTEQQTAWNAAVIAIRLASSVNQALEQPTTEQPMGKGIYQNLDFETRGNSHVIKHLKTVVAAKELTDEAWKVAKLKSLLSEPNSDTEQNQSE